MTRNSAFLRWIPLFLIGSSHSLASDIPADLHIDRATVYRESAIVTRTGQIAVPAGANRLVVRGLPASVDAKTLRFTLEGGSVLLGAVELAEVKENHVASEAERELKRKIEDLGDERIAIKDEITTAETQLKLLSTVATGPTSAVPKPPIDASNLAVLLSSVASGDSAARKRIRDARIRLRSLDGNEEKLKSDLAKLAGDDSRHTDIHASVDAPAAATVHATVSYMVMDAGWEWIYRARLDSDTKKIDFDRQGSVHQDSGEDWKSIELTLTTALPADDIATPSVSSVYLQLATDEDLKVSKRAAAPSPGLAGNDLQEIVVTGAQRQSASASGTDYITDYKLPARITLKSEGDPQIYPIAQDEFDVQLVARIMPSASHRAHLESVFQYKSELPIEAGQVALYRDGAFIGEVQLPAFLPSAEIRMPFGTDERIRVEVREEQGQSGQRGILSKQSVKESRQRFDVTSFHSAPISIEIVDHVPVSKNSDVRVEILKGSTEPTVRDFDGKPGVLLWRIDAQPQKSISIRHYYSIQYPAGRQLQRIEAAE